MTKIQTACALIRAYGNRCIAASVKLLIDAAGLTINDAARYVFAVLRAQRAVA